MSPEFRHCLQVLILSLKEEILWKAENKQEEPMKGLGVVRNNPREGVNVWIMALGFKVI